VKKKVRLRIYLHSPIRLYGAVCHFSNFVRVNRQVLCLRLWDSLEIQRIGIFAIGSRYQRTGEDTVD
jgi:hypothetical protein